MPQLLLWHFLFFRPPADPFPRSSPWALWPSAHPGPAARHPSRPPPYRPRRPPGGGGSLATPALRRAVSGLFPGLSGKGTQPQLILPRSWHRHQPRPFPRSWHFTARPMTDSLLRPAYGGTTGTSAHEKGCPVPMREPPGHHFNYFSLKKPSVISSLWLRHAEKQPALARPGTAATRRRDHARSSSFPPHQRHTGPSCRAPGP